MLSIGMMGARTALTNRLHPVRIAWLAALGVPVVLALGGNIAARTPDIELGRYLAAECMTCHRGSAV